MLSFNLAAPLDSFHRAQIAATQRGDPRRLGRKVFELCNVLSRDAELATDVLVKECRVSEHRAQSDKCSLAVGAVKAAGLIMCSWNDVYC